MTVFKTKIFSTPNRGASITEVLLAMAIIAMASPFVYSQIAKNNLSGYFRWSFADERFTLWQRTDYNSDMCFSHRILDMPFCMLAARDKENDERVFN